MADEPDKPLMEPATDERFVSRWSRLKREAAREEAEPPAVPPKSEAADEPPELPPVEELTMDSDYRGFLHPKVDDKVRRAALKKLFTDPHFNIMDGLDTYIDDYSKTEPLPAGMLAQLAQAQKILQWAAEKTEGPEANALPENRAAELTNPDERPEAAAVVPATAPVEELAPLPPAEPPTRT
jgi:hypothetical protein